MTKSTSKEAKSTTKQSPTKKKTICEALASCKTIGVLQTMSEISTVQMGKRQRQAEEKAGDSV